VFEKVELRGTFECKSEEVTRRCSNERRNEQPSSNEVKDVTGGGGGRGQ
jgi:hypothetical protein